jgi:predicted PurR-regulated permease PerM
MQTPIEPVEPVRADTLAIQPQAASTVPGRKPPDRARPDAPGALLALALAYTAYLAAPLLIPIAVAVLLHFLFTPLIKQLYRWHVPRALGAVMVVGLLVLVAFGSMYRLATPASEWLREAPSTLNEIRFKLRSGDDTLARVREASDAVERVVDDITGSGPAEAGDPPAVEIREPAMLDSVIDLIPTIVASFAVVAVLTLFLLISGDRLLRKITALGPTFAARRRIVAITRQIEREIARYLGTVALINAALGVVVAAAMYFVGLPNPMLWGAIAAIMNFAPYLGAIITIFVIFVVSVSTFDGTLQMLLPPLVFLGITTLEGQIITPLLLGQRMALSPVVVLLSVLLLGWIWGLVGALVAVPLVASVRIALINVPRTRPFGELLAD